MNWTPDQDPRLVIFFFECPEPIMLPNGTTWHFSLDEEVEWLKNIQPQAVEGVTPTPEEWMGHIFVSFRFWRSTAHEDLPVPSDALMQVIKQVFPPTLKVPTRVGVVGSDAQLEQLDRHLSEWHEHEGGEETVAYEDLTHRERDVTIIEAVTPLLPPVGDLSPIDHALHRCMESFAEFTRVYRLANGLPMHPVTYERLPPTVIWASRKMINEEGNEWDELSELLVFPSRLPGRTHHAELGEKELQRFTSYYERFRMGYPLVPYSERTLDARLSFDSLGDYTNCVIQCQTAVEVLFDALLYLLLWEEGMEPEKVATEIFKDRGLQKRVRTHFHPRLGGNWKTEGRGPVARWAQYLAPLRNRTVHAAYHPTRLEAGNALAAVTDLDRFVRDRLVAKRNRYMRSTLMILGQPGLERYGAWSGKIKRFVEERIDDEPDWDQSFRQWKEQVLAVRARIERTA
jgi:hypothetical protein